MHTYRLTHINCVFVQKSLFYTSFIKKRLVRFKSASLFAGKTVVRSDVLLTDSATKSIAD